MFIDAIGLGNPAEKAGLDFDFEIASVLGVNDRPPKELMSPTLVVLGLIIWLQRRRSPNLAPVTAIATAGGA
jgi:hypothetical protein